MMTMSAAGAAGTAGAGAASTAGAGTKDTEMILNSNSNSNGEARTGAAQILSSGHLDYIHHVAFDHYGRRLATCSGDRFVRIWDLSEDGDWTVAAEWQAHRGPVTQLKWAHPEFGPLLATTGADHDCKIWEEREPACVSSEPTQNSGTANNTTTINNINNNNNGPTSRWVCKASLTEARRAATCLEFAPRQWGLKLATGSADGMIRIYEAVDIMNLAQWPLQATVAAFPSEGDTTIGGSTEPMMLASSSSASAPATTPAPPLGVTCLSWCTGRFEAPALVVGGSHLAIYRYSDASRQWQPLMTLSSPGTSSSSIGGGGAGNSSSSGVLDVAWAPNVGRRFHLIAAVVDQKLTVYKLNRTNTFAENGTPDYELELDSSQVLEQSSDSEGITQQQQQQQHQQQVWRCQWNVTGTVLASSGDGGMVQLWKSDFEGKWKCVSQIYGDLATPGNWKD